MKATLFLLFVCVTSFSSGQADQIFELFDQKSYQEIIATYGASYKELDYEASFHVGMSFYKLAKDKNTIEVMDHCIKANGEDSRPLYIKAKSLNFLGQFGKAASVFEKAIELDQSNPSYYCGLGDAYMSMTQLDRALESYQSATKLKDCPERAYQKIPLILSAMGRTIPALEAYYVAKEKLDRGSDSYNNILYKIGIYERMNGDYFEAKVALKELLDLDPNYFKAYPVLIQTYMGLRDHDPIVELKSKLYEANKKGLLKFTMPDKFCFDQFEWDGKFQVFAYERFESDKKGSYVKHIFEVVEDDMPIYSIQTMHVPGQSQPYVLYKSNADKMIELPYKFSQKDSYVKIKSAVMTALKSES